MRWCNIYGHILYLSNILTSKFSFLFNSILESGQLEICIRINSKTVRKFLFNSVNFMIHVIGQEMAL